MNKTCESCSSCGMPFEKPTDHALGDLQNPYCSYCTTPDGILKTYSEILQGMVQFLVHSQGINEIKAQEIAEDTLKKLPAWNKKAK